MARPPLFLERRTYRRNRLQDAARLLPVLGAVLFFGPVFIRGEAGEGPGLGDWLAYFFVIWAGLIAVTMLVSRALTVMAPGSEPPDPGLPGAAAPPGAAAAPAHSAPPATPAAPAAAPPAGGAA